MNPIKLPIKLVACIALTIFAGCSSTRNYVEPPENAEATAKIEATVPVWIQEIDGRKIAAGGFGDTRVVRVAPGRHEVVVNFRTVESADLFPAGSQRSPLPNKAHRSTVSQPVNIPIVAKPGFNYVIQFDRDKEKNQVRFWVGEFEDIQPAAAREMKPKH